MEYDQYIVPDAVAVETTLALANIRPWALLLFFQISLENLSKSKCKTIHNTFRDVACSFSDNLSRNSCIQLKMSESSS